ncbi:hypothetical protein F5I97DRAFT_1983207 [Phlebopus sp. FC_14]|nr:hypothetical protein F5I97DRAFT_1983207 [Phlebopus sp. FC_14]
MHIFLLAARLRREMSLHLMLVARRVKIWVEGYVYKTIVLRDASHADRFLSALSFRPSSFASTRIKALCICPRIPGPLAHRLLTLCTGIRSLALWLPAHAQLGTPSGDPTTTATQSLLQLISSLPLTSLSTSIDLMSLLSAPTGTHAPGTVTASLNPHHLSSLNQAPANLTPPRAIFPTVARLTHLDIVTHWALWTSSFGIEHLPHLTHLAFRSWARGDISAALGKILGGSRSLEVLVLIVDGVVFASARGVYLEKNGVRDGRVVVMRREGEEWEMWGEREIEEKGGMWACAEGVVQWRKEMGGRFPFLAGIFLNESHADRMEICSRSI